MNCEMAYLIGMILGNGEIQMGHSSSTITIDIPHKNMWTDNRENIPTYVKASTVDIRNIIEPLIGFAVRITQTDNVTKLSFDISNNIYIFREILFFTMHRLHHSVMYMHPALFNITKDEKIELLKGIADVTGHIRRSNIYIKNFQHRVYIEVPSNWQLVADISNMLKDIDVPIQTIDFGHPNFRDSNLIKFKEGKINYWKKEHQIKIFANEFLPIGFNIQHKQEALVRYSNELLVHNPQLNTHLFYWQRNIKPSLKLSHPGEEDPSLPDFIRNRHFNSWTELADLIGYKQ